MSVPQVSVEWLSGVPLDCGSVPESPGRSSHELPVSSAVAVPVGERMTGWWW